MPTTTSHGDSIHYVVFECTSAWIEQPETIVFHHGVGACGGIWSGWISALNERYRLVMLDMRGHGNSPLPAGFSWSMPGMLDDLAAVINTVVGPAGQVHLVGESIGGTAVMAFAAQYPDRVARLIVCNGAHAGGTIRNVNTWAGLIERDGMAGWSAHMMTCRFYSGALSEAPWRWYEAQQAACNPNAILAALGVLTQVDLSDELPGMQPPVLLLHPDDSPFIPVALMAELQQGLRDARLQVFAKARHGLPFSHARACARATLEFLDAG